MDSGFKPLRFPLPPRCPIKEDNAAQIQSRPTSPDISPHSRTQRSTKSAVQAGEVIKIPAPHMQLHTHMYTSCGEIVHHYDIIAATRLPLQVTLSRLFSNSCAILFLCLMRQEAERMSVTCASMPWRGNRMAFCCDL